LAVRTILKNAIDRCLDQGESAEVSLLRAQKDVDILLAQ